MVRSDLMDYLQKNVIWDALYTEKSYETDRGIFIECSVWSASAGYTVTVTRGVQAYNNRNMQATRDILLKKVLGEKDKFIQKFDFDDDSLDGLEVLFNDGFIYDEEL